MGLGNAAGLAEQILAAVLQLADTQTPHRRAHAGLVDDISGFTARLLDGQAIGTSGRHR